MQKCVTKRGQSDKNVPPRVPPGLQNETLEPPKFIKNSDLTPLRAKRWPHRLQRHPPKPNFDQNHQTYDQKSTKSVQKPFAKQCKLTFKDAVEMHLELHCYIFCETKFKESVTAAGWAKPTRIDTKSVPKVTSNRIVEHTPQGS